MKLSVLLPLFNEEKCLGVYWLSVKWRGCILRNNAITEGFHTKMETLQRQAYRFRNFQNYRLRVKVLCG